MAAYNKFNSTLNDVFHKVMNLNTAQDTLKVALCNTAPVATNAVLADLTQITAQNGYSAGGTATSITSSTQSSGTFKLVCSNIVFTAAAGSFGPLRYAVLYDDTPTSPADPLISWWDYGSSITINDTETLTVAFDQTNGVFQAT